MDTQCIMVWRDGSVFYDDDDDDDMNSYDERLKTMVMREEFFPLMEEMKTSVDVMTKAANGNTCQSPSVSVQCRCVICVTCVILFLSFLKRILWFSRPPQSFWTAMTSTQWFGWCWKLGTIWMPLVFFIKNIHPHIHPPQFYFVFFELLNHNSWI